MISDTHIPLGAAAYSDSPAAAPARPGICSRCKWPDICKQQSCVEFPFTGPSPDDRRGDATKPAVITDTSTPRIPRELLPGTPPYVPDGVKAPYTPMGATQDAPVNPAVTQAATVQDGASTPSAPSTLTTACRVVKRMLDDDVDRCNTARNRFNELERHSLMALLNVVRGEGYEFD